MLVLTVVGLRSAGEATDTVRRSDKGVDREASARVAGYPECGAIAETHYGSHFIAVVQESCYKSSNNGKQHGPVLQFQITHRLNSAYDPLIFFPLRRHSKV